MLKPEDNERLVRVGPGTPMGNAMRRYWLPALLSSELPEKDGAPVRTRLLCEDLVAFRDSNGNVGLVDAYCPHRSFSYMTRLDCMLLREIRHARGIQGTLSGHIVTRSKCRVHFTFTIAD